jgi:flagellar hook-basal body complex protein FliE
MSDFSVISTSAVRGAYKSSQSLAADKTVAPQENDENSFTALVRNATASAVETVRSGEVTAQAGLRGEADTQQVVEAMMAMESTVKVAVSVRDRFVEAYQEILRMPI